MGMYTQPDSLIPYKKANGDGFLLGIYKTLIEVFHTILESMLELSKFLGATPQNPIKIFPTKKGCHSHPWCGRANLLG